MDEKELERLAIEEIYKEIAIKAVRANEIGPSGWLDCPLKKTNKRFLGNTITAAVKHNERKLNEERNSSSKKLHELKTRTINKQEKRCYSSSSKQSRRRA